jgi:hypothetical protein
MPKLPRPEEYLGIRLWGEQTLSSSAYIRRQQDLAAHDNAPADAIFKGALKGDWATVSGLAETHPFRKYYAQALKRATMP